MKCALISLSVALLCCAAIVAAGVDGDQRPIAVNGSLQLTAQASALVAKLVSTDALTKFADFVRSYKRSYAGDEFVARLRLFASRVLRMQESRKLYASGSESYALGINKFFDWTAAEMSALKSIRAPSKDELRAADEAAIVLNDDEMLEIDENARQVDWRQSGCLSPIRDQEDCGGCYAFATIGAIEAAMCLRNSSSVLLSPQQLIDCSTSHDNYGCDGGWPAKVFRFVEDKAYLVRDFCYPFVKAKRLCKNELVVRMAKQCVVDATLSGKQTFKHKEVKGHAAMLKYLATKGPLVGLVEATEDYFYYKEGIFFDHSCKPVDSANHAILLVGYGEEKGQKYWLMKNSWGLSWGQDGYGKIRRGVNMCSVENRAWFIEE